MSAKIKYGLSAAVLALIAAGASVLRYLTSFWTKKRVTTQRHTAMVPASDHLSGAHDGGWKTRFSRMKTVEGKMRPGQRPLSVIRRWHGWEKNIKVPLSEPQKAGSRHSVRTTLVPVSVSRRRFINELMQVIAGERVRRFAGGLRTVAETAVFVQTNCYGQVSRRDQESALACWGIDR
ncbi:membrane-associated lysozyme; Qin prophage [Escherichia coli]|uniref:Membrane-associated lysozyme Qin prophage n=1 Tax=Escherichia coli TaxID=562 RepID=A0A376ZF34_ECOLX|nr:membrane-associated lysozyme; Qin prophage [Escherichia coli]